jgi:hypothetical protein
MKKTQHVLKAIIKNSKFPFDNFYKALKNNDRFNNVFKDMADEITDIIHDDERLQKILAHKIFEN